MLWYAQPLPYQCCTNRPVQLSSARSTLIPEHIRTTLIPSQGIPSSPTLRPSHLHLTPQTAPLSRPESWLSTPDHDRPFRAQDLDRAQHHRFSSSRFSDISDEDVQERTETDSDYAIRRPLPLTLVPHTAPVTRAPSVVRSPSHALATPRPTLLFAIASDDPQEVRRVLQSGEAGANDMAGPQSALAFTLTNDQLTRKLDIVKTLLAFGADPAALKDPALNPPHRSESGETLAQSPPPPPTLMEGMDAATR